MGGFDFRFQFQKIKKVRLCRRLQRIAGNVGSHFLKPEGKPGTFKAGMAGYETFFPFQNLLETFLMISRPSMAPCPSPKGH